MDRTDPREAWSARLALEQQGAADAGEGCDAPERVVDIVAYQTAETHRAAESRKKRQARALATHIGRVREALPNMPAPCVDARLDRDEASGRTVARVHVRHAEGPTPGAVRRKRAEYLAAMLPALEAVPGAGRLAERVRACLAAADSAGSDAAGGFDAPGYVPALLVMSVRDVVERHAVLRDMIDEAADEHARHTHSSEVDVFARSSIAKAIESGRQSMLESMVRRAHSGQLPQANPCPAEAAPPTATGVPHPASLPVRVSRPL